MSDFRIRQISILSSRLFVQRCVPGGIDRQREKSALRSPGLNFTGAATLAFIHRYQPALLHIELLFDVDFPFMKTPLAQGVALVLLRGFFLFEGDDVGHYLKALS